MYADIFLPLKLGEGRTLTYRIPETLKKEVAVGSVVRISVRNRSYTGVVKTLHNKSLTFAAKEILNTQKGGPLLAPWQFELAEWMSAYYFAPFYKALKMMLPQKLWQGRREIPSETFYEHTTKLVAQEKIHNSPPKILTQEQKNIIKAIKTSRHQKFLIHGVTGSGKTELYLRLAEDTVKQGKQVLLLVPEISLTPQLIDYFNQTFGDAIAVWHSHLSIGEREREWWRIQTKSAQVVIGSRSALFTPLNNVGLIVLDEEHEWSYKQDQSPYYHARTVAFKIGELTGTKVILGSATPDVETTYWSELGEIERFTLKERIHEKAELPHVQIVDMRGELHSGNFSMFSYTLSERLEQTLARKEQTILFLNRRGYSSSLLCRDCGHTPPCKNCDVNLTYHRFRTGLERLVCHHCGLIQEVPSACVGCGSYAIKNIGLGTERIEEELQKKFPLARILRADRDTTSTKDSFKQLYRAMKNNEADILIGTQMVSKGLDLPNVTLVGVILADIGLHIPDFRSGERAFQLLTQVAGRSGRADKKGHVVIQTYNPDHPSIQAAAQHDYTTFYSREIQARYEQKNPPLTRIIKMKFKHSDQKNCSKEATRIEKQLNALTQDHSITAAPALIPRKYNHYRWHVFIQGSNPHQVLQKLLDKEPLPQGWSIDVDPLMMS